MKLVETKNSLASVTNGVPQGSVLGPVLFSTYMSSYSPYDDKVSVVKYADDISIILPVLKDSIDDLSAFHNEVRHFESWCQQYQMVISQDKTKILNFNFRSTSLLPCPGFDNVCVLKVLGVMLNDRKSWS